MGTFGKCTPVERSTQHCGFQALACDRYHFMVTAGGGGGARGEFCGENFAVNEGGENFPWRSVGVTIPSFTTAAGIVFPEKRQARLRTHLSQPFLAQMHEMELENTILGCGNVVQFCTLCLVHVLSFCCSHLGVWHLKLWGFKGGEIFPWRNYPQRICPQARCSHPL